MVKFLIERPIAVLMTYLSIVIIGVLAYLQLPVSLMPDIDIPIVTVQVSYPNSSARELQNSIVNPLRNQLLQVSHLNDIKTECRDGMAIILLHFKYGTNINYAFLEVNEKIDGSLNYLPKALERPKVIKASVTDIPVLDLSINLRKDSLSEKDFLQLSEFCENIIKRRIEQLPNVAMADISGCDQAELIILPNKNKLLSLNISYQDIELALLSNNIDIGSLQIKDGQYQYNIKFSSVLRSISDIENIYLKKDEHIFQLKDIAEIKIKAQAQKGIYMQSNKRAVVLQIIKQSDARMQNLKSELIELINLFESDYPDIEFNISRNQTALLDYSISNLKLTLLYGGILSFLIMFFFLKNIRSPILIGISISVSLIIAFIFFYLFGISINIISLSGLVLGIGMMIDNSIIVIDNINQYYERTALVSDSCIRGTNEIIRPLLSSVLTTCAVFLPLIFLSGISGAIFYDQAIAVSVGLFASYIVSITLIPTFYRLLYLKNRSLKIDKFIQKFNKIKLEFVYEKILNLVFKKKAITLIIFLSLVLLSVLFGFMLEKEKLPEIEQTEIILNIDWNENISIDENKIRVAKFLKTIDTLIQSSNSFIGEQQFLLNQKYDLSFSEASVYIKTNKQIDINNLKDSFEFFIKNKYPLTNYSFEKSENIFQKLFDNNNSKLELQIMSVNQNISPNIDTVNNIIKKINSDTKTNFKTNITTQTNKQISILSDKLLIYNLDYQTVYQTLKTLFRNNKIGTLKSYNKFIPIILSDHERHVSDIINNSDILNSKGEKIPLKSIISVQDKTDYKMIISGKQGEYIPIIPHANKIDYKKLIAATKESMSSYNEIQINFTGNYFHNKKMFQELFIVLLISILLLYFILAAQFESFSLPLIVLIEIPIDIFGSFFLLYLFGVSLNIMSAIGIVVMSGIIINDSILKIDTINKELLSRTLIDAILVGGKRRLKPILMTSITTIVALIPFFFTTGIGAELQRPFAISVIGGMIIGTIVSLFLIPVLFWFLKIIFKRFNR